MNAGVTTLKLPDGGIVELPLPGAKSRFVVRGGSMFSSSSGSGRLVPILIGVTVGLAIGITATAWYMRRH